MRALRRPLFFADFLPKQDRKPDPTKAVISLRTFPIETAPIICRRPPKRLICEDPRSSVTYRAYTIPECSRHRNDHSFDIDHKQISAPHARQQTHGIAPRYRAPRFFLCRRRSANTALHVPHLTEYMIPGSFGSRHARCKSAKLVVSIIFNYSMSTQYSFYGANKYLPPRILRGHAKLHAWY